MPIDIFSFRRFIPRWVGFALGLLLLGGWLPGSAFSQEDEPAVAGKPVAYIQDKVDDTFKSQANAVVAMLRGPGAIPNQQQFDDYYNKYALPRWTIVKNLNANDKESLKEYRKELKTNFNTAKSGETHDHLNELVLKFMTERAEKNYHPAVRYNAMLAIGELNLVDGSQSVVWENALPVLLDAVNNPKQIDPVKVAALIGVNRHVKAGINKPELQKQVADAMLKLIAGSNSADSADASDPGRDWIKMQAVEILGLLRSVGDNNKALNAIVQVVANDKLSPSIRSTAVEALKDLDYSKAAAWKPADVVSAIGQFMLSVCAEELKNIDKVKKNDFLRRMKSPLGAALNTLGTLNSLPQSDHKFSDEGKAILDELAKELDKPDSLRDLDAAKKILEDCQSKLKTWLAAKP